jgi:8-oxo-dGTP diphosphatase
MLHTRPVLIPAAGGIVFDEARRLLLIRRGREPGLGTWSIPGGRCEPGESPARACVREVAEETGLEVVIERLVGRVIRDAPGGGQYVIDDFLCRQTGGSVRPGDDATDVDWFSRSQLAEALLADGVAASLTRWQMLPE